MGGLYLQEPGALSGNNYVVKSEPLSSPSRTTRDGFVPTPRLCSRLARGLMIEPEKTSESDQPQAANISQENVRSVQAHLVRMHQAAAETIQAEEVALHQ